VVLRADGKKYEQEVLAPLGDSDQPMTWEDVEQKAKRIGRRFFDPSKIDKLGACVKGLDNMKKIDSLLDLLTRGPL
jgi:2-methylcitrate dehydratase PrpD